MSSSSSTYQQRCCNYMPIIVILCSSDSPLGTHRETLSEFQLITYYTVGWTVRTLYCCYYPVYRYSSVRPNHFLHPLRRRFCCNFPQDGSAAFHQQLMRLFVNLDLLFSLRDKALSMNRKQLLMKVIGRKSFSLPKITNNWTLFVLCSLLERDRHFACALP